MEPLGLDLSAGVSHGVLQGGGGLGERCGALNEPEAVGPCEVAQPEVVTGQNYLVEAFRSCSGLHGVGDQGLPENQGMVFSGEALTPLTSEDNSEDLRIRRQGSPP